MRLPQQPVALVTGASSGMGKDFALRLIAEGYLVHAAARRVDRMEDIRAAGGRILTMDVTDEVSMSAGVGRIVDEQGRIDAFINNAGPAGALQGPVLSGGGARRALERVRQRRERR